MSAYAPSVSIRKLFAMLVAVAVLFAPAVTGLSAALAAVPDHHMQMMSTGHCKALPSGENSDQSPGKDSKAGKPCCIAMCIAVAATPAEIGVSQPLVGVANVPTLQSFLIGAPAEIATPPPRAA